MEKVSAVIISNRQKTYLHASIWVAAALVGITAVLYAKLISWSQGLYLDVFATHPYLISFSTPLLFLAAAGLVQKFAMEAKGSGIPQVLEAIDLAKEEGNGHTVWRHQLVSVRTAFIKIISSSVGILGGCFYRKRRADSSACSLRICMDWKPTQKNLSQCRFPVFFDSRCSCRCSSRI